MMWFLLGCTEPPLLDRVANAYGEAVVDESAMAVGLFVSVGALIAEPCAADNVDAYTLTGQGYRAFRVQSPNVTIEDSGARTYEYGTVAFEGDVGSLTLTSDSKRRAWSARFDGVEGSFSGAYTLSECEVDEAEVPVRAGLSGSGTYAVADGTKQDLSISGGADALLQWSPPTAAVPTAGELTWRIADEDLTLELADASEIEPVERAWPGVANGGSWVADVAVELP
jgi:hypothetical protein